LEKEAEEYIVESSPPNQTASVAISIPAVQKPPGFTDNRCSFPVRIGGCSTKWQKPWFTRTSHRQHIAICRGRPVLGWGRSASFDRANTELQVYSLAPVDFPVEDEVSLLRTIPKCVLAECLSFVGTNSHQ